MDCTALLEFSQLLETLADRTIETIVTFRAEDESSWKQLEEVEQILTECRSQFPCFRMTFAATGPHEVNREIVRSYHECTLKLCGEHIEGRFHSTMSAADVSFRMGISKAVIERWVKRGAPWQSDSPDGPGFNVFRLRRWLVANGIRIDEPIGIMPMPECIVAGLRRIKVYLMKEASEAADWEFKRQWSNRSENDHPPREDLPEIDDTDVSILEYLAGNPGIVRKQIDIALAINSNEKTIRPHLNTMMESGYVKRPDGKKQGYVITYEGKKRITAGKYPEDSR